MSSAIGLVGFGSAAGVNPNSHGRGLSPWRMLGRNLSTVSTAHGQRFPSDGHTVSPLERVVLSVLEGVMGFA